MSCNSTVDDTIRPLRNEGFSFAKIKRIVGCGQDRISRAIAEPMGVCVAKRPGPKPKLGLEALNMVEESTLGTGTGGRRWLGTLLIADIIAAQKSCDDAVASSSRFPTWISESSTRHCPVLTLYRAPVGFRKQSFAFQV